MDQTNNMGGAPVNPAPQPQAPQTPPPQHHHEMSVGAMVAAILILVVVLVGALYFWNDRRNAVDDTMNGNAGAEMNTQLSTSDETADIEADLESMDLESIDAELDAEY